MGFLIGPFQTKVHKNLASNKCVAQRVSSPLAHPMISGVWKEEEVPMMILCEIVHSSWSLM